ncbi:MAG: flagellar motor switch phosphatase FliY, partial [Lachnospiraceae bacterium]|nr:flagellar motor switch phosphatase FliY [Lachnospiraceae bacterium]
MNDMLSQDEINALLNGMDLSESASTDSTAPTVSNDIPPIDESLLSDVEKDAVGEVANISMGSSATTLYSLVNQKVNITTPTVSMANWNTVLAEYEKPCVFIQIKYTEGLDGTNILVLKERDVKIITDLMMGGDGSNIEGELGELHLSAISEAMNQMMGSSATSLSTMLGMLIDISPPEASRVDLTEYHNGSDISPFLGGTFVKVSFQMQIGDLVDSNIMQLYPVDFAKKIVETFMSEQMGGASASAPSPAPAPAAAPAPSSAPVQPAPQPAMGMDPQAAMGMNPMYGVPMQGMPMQG